jgi:hypothetical protein
VLKGKSPTPGSYVECRTGTSGKYVRASGTAAWKIVLKLKRGKNVFFLHAVSSSTEKKSSDIKVVVFRR